jgi:hypothetical protein
MHVVRPNQWKRAFPDERSLPLANLLWDVIYLNYIDK